VTQPYLMPPPSLWLCAFPCRILLLLAPPAASLLSASSASTAEASESARAGLSLPPEFADLMAPPARRWSPCLPLLGSRADRPGGATPAGGGDLAGEGGSVLLGRALGLSSFFDGHLVTSTRFLNPCIPTIGQ